MCGQGGHIAGFVGAKYIDCPNKPCYLCGQRGHSTMTCPFRWAPPRRLRDALLGPILAGRGAHGFAEGNAASMIDPCPFLWLPLCCWCADASRCASPPACLPLVVLAVPLLPCCRVAPGHGCTHAAGLSNDTLLSALRQRERGGR